MVDCRQLPLVSVVRTVNIQAALTYAVQERFTAFLMVTRSATQWLIKSLSQENTADLHSVGRVP
jgi:hypothetical protein